MDMKDAWDDVWSFILGVGLGILIGTLITVFNIGLTSKKFCPTCGKTYADAVYCEDDGTLLKERGN
jgi:uncharacterized membrane protein YczE